MTPKHRNPITQDVLTSARFEAALGELDYQLRHGAQDQG
jgi:hypothetical protein